MSDGNIQTARTKLDLAVGKLVDKRMAVYHDATLYAPSLYACLISDLAGTQGDTRTPAKSLPPVWIDAVQLRGDIDAQVHRWVAMPGTTPWRLTVLTQKSWRPQDTKMVTDIARTVVAWCETIIGMLEPESRLFLEGKNCPSCGKSTAYRKDSAGETVRQHALKVTPQGCTCQQCGEFWAPEKFMFLGRLLGNEVPEGVLE